MNIFQSIILSIIEGLTEFLPVSSTGHMILASHLMGIAENPFTKNFEIIIQLAAIMAVVFLYFKRILENKTSILKVMIAFLPTSIIGFTLYPYIKKYLFDSPTVVVIALFVGGVLMIIFENSKLSKIKPESINGGSNNENTDGRNVISGIDSVAIENQQILNDISYKKAFFVGIWQSLAMVPGVSRSAATIIGGEIMGISRKTIVEFSFLLAVPTMLGATVLDLYKSNFDFSPQEVNIIIIGCVVSFVVSILAIKTFIRYIQNHSFRIFGYYRIILAIFYAIIFL